MAMVDLKHLHSVRSNGRVYHYAWRGGPRIKADLGTIVFVNEYVEHHAKRIGGNKKRFESLVIAYKLSDAWINLSEKTRANWRPWLDRIQTAFGEFTLASFERPAARAMIRSWRNKYRLHPRAADVGLQVFSRLLSFGASEGILATNIIDGNIEHLYRNNRAEMIWTASDLAKLASTAPKPIIDAASLAALTGLRQGDLLRLAWSHVRTNSIEMATGKSGGRKTTLIPLYGELRRFIGSLPKKATTLLVNSDGVPWKSGFGSSWSKACDKAQIADLHFHDLRGTAATRFYLAGFSAREIAEIMTWGEAHVEALINRYVKRDEILLGRIRRLDEAETGTPTVKTTVKPT